MISDPEVRKMFAAGGAGRNTLFVPMQSINLLELSASLSGVTQSTNEHISELLRRFHVAQK